MSDAAFITLLNMSLTAGYVILALLCLRLLLPRAPKWLLYSLWALPLFRLICPFSVESMLSLLPSAQPIPTDITLQALPQIHSGIPALNSAVNPALAQSAPAAAASVNPLQIWCFVGKALWLVGMTVLLGYGILSYVRLQSRLRFAVGEGGVYRGDMVPEPMVLGFFRPRVYLPSHVSGTEYILAHERAHIARKDHLVKPLAYVVLCVHWFNPLAWLAFHYMVKDMEGACDEQVLRNQGPAQRQAYANCLLEMGLKRSGLAVPLAFGESDVAGRIKRILHYKKPAFWLIALLLLVAIFLCATLLTNPKSTPDNTVGIIGGADGPTTIWISDGEGENAQAYGLVLQPEGGVVGVNLPNFASHPVTQAEPAFSHGLSLEELADITPIPLVFGNEGTTPPTISILVHDGVEAEGLTLQETLLGEDGSILYRDGAGNPLLQEDPLTSMEVKGGRQYTYTLEPSQWNLLRSSLGPYDTFRCFSLQYTQNGALYECCFVLRTQEGFAVSGGDMPAQTEDAGPAIYIHADGSVTGMGIGLVEFGLEQDDTPNYTLTNPEAWEDAPLVYAGGGLEVYGEEPEAIQNPSVSYVAMGEDGSILSAVSQPVEARLEGDHATLLLDASDYAKEHPEALEGGGLRCYCFSWQDGEGNWRSVRFALRVVEAETVEASLEAVQQRLAELGYLAKDRLTGQYDQATKAAVLGFQQQINAAGLANPPLEEDGILGAETSRLLFSQLAPPA